MKNFSISKLAEIILKQRKLLKLTQQELADKAGTSASYVSRLINNPDKLVNKVFIELYESLGYDIELHYVRNGE